MSYMRVMHGTLTAHENILTTERDEYIINRIYEVVRAVAILIRINKNESDLFHYTTRKSDRSIVRIASLRRGGGIYQK